MPQTAMTNLNKLGDVIPGRYTKPVSLPHYLTKPL